MTRSAFISILLLALAFCVSATSVRAVNPDEILDDPKLEERARELSKGLRCVVCRNQSIDDSNAGIARDMRIVLRERLVAGDDDTEAKQFLVDRYGEFILLKPPFKPVTYLLWATPVVILLLTLWGFSRLWRNHPREDPATTPVSAEDRKLISRLLQDESGQK